MDLTPVQDLLTVLSGAVVGFSLGLIGGGGSILAVPLLVYVVGVKSPHVAIGTSALAVAVIAGVNLVTHWRAGNLKLRCALVFAGAGVAGALIGSSLGKAFDGDKLLALFGILMIVVGLSFVRRPAEVGRPDVHLDAQSAAVLLPRLLLTAFPVGFVAGFFGIGGGFLIVPGLVFAAGMPLLSAVGSSLLPVTAFGLTTAGNYAISGLVDWQIAALLLAGGAAGGLLGAVLARRLAARKPALSLTFAGIVVAVGVYMIWRGIDALTT